MEETMEDGKRSKLTLTIHRKVCFELPFISLESNCFVSFHVPLCNNVIAPSIL